MPDPTLEVDRVDARVFLRVAAAAVASLRTVRIISRPEVAVFIDGRGSRNQILMRRKTRAFVRLEHPIGERVLLGHVEIRLRLRLRYVAVRARITIRTAAR